jgi:glutamyl-tRNA synthetase
LPLLLNSDGTKLSKRQDDIRLEYFRKQGFYPEAIIGLLCLVGGGFSSSIDIQQNLYSLSELAKSVLIKKISCLFFFYFVELSSI